MTEEEIKWQIPVLNHCGGEDYVNYKSKPHAFIVTMNNISLCGKYTFNEYYECINTNLKSRFYIKPTKEIFCNKCLKELDKLRGTK